MYSGRDDGQKNGSKRKSYLFICFTEHLETFLKNELKANLDSIFLSDKYCKFEFRSHSPKVIAEKPEDNPCLVYINDPQYWNVFNIEFELSNGHPDKHEQFWNVLSESLSAL